MWCVGGLWYGVCVSVVYIGGCGVCEVCVYCICGVVYVCMCGVVSLWCFMMYEWDVRVVWYVCVVCGDSVMCMSVIWGVSVVCKCVVCVCGMSMVCKCVVCVCGM